MPSLDVYENNMPPRKYTFNVSLIVWLLSKKWSNCIVTQILGTVASPLKAYLDKCYSKLVLRIVHGRYIFPYVARCHLWTLRM